jgi:Tfp pilus assembly protein PilN
VYPDSATIEADEVIEAPSGTQYIRLFLWLVVLCLGIVLVAMLMTFTSLQDAQSRLRAEAANVQLTLAVTPQTPPEQSSLRAELISIQNQVAEIASVRTTLDTLHLDVPQMMSIVGTYDPGRIKLTSLTQQPDRILLRGAAVDNNSVLFYVDTLKTSSMFQTVRLESVNVTGAATEFIIVLQLRLP